jgi:hypothetical protein
MTPVVGSMVSAGLGSPTSLRPISTPAPPKMVSEPSGRMAGVVRPNKEELPPMISSWPSPP